jgi:hypothetical protein
VPRSEIGSLRGNSLGEAAGAPGDSPRASGLDLAATPGSTGPGSPRQGPVDGSTIRVERPLSLVVACGPTGVTIQPGGHRLTAPYLEPAEGRLVALLRELVRRHEAREGGRVLVKPTLTFLVEPGGQTTYAKARQQTILAGLGWPVRLRIAEGEALTAGLAGSVLR